MQFTKDSFYMTLRDRLTAANPERTIDFSGQTRPAVVVVENECAGTTADLMETYLIEWQHGERSESRGPASIGCSITFRTLGGEALCGRDRGRMLAELQEELSEILQPAVAEKIDYCDSVLKGLGTKSFWTIPQFGEVETDGARLTCRATLQVCFFPEVTA